MWKRLFSSRFIRSMKIRPVPALQDNYMYLLIDEKTHKAAAIDPVEPENIISAAKEEGVEIGTVLTTHHHWDHSGGNEAIAKLIPKVPVYGGDKRIGALTHEVTHNSEFKIGSLSVRCLFTPCHTSGHICYYVVDEENDSSVVFTGDTLFLGGCGRFFEGTADQMHAALIEILGKLPMETKVYCGHEYAASNLKFCSVVEPDNADLNAKIAWVKEKRDEGLPTVPSTLREEFTYNCFMRVNVDSVKAHVGESDPVKVMEKLREEKNSFRPK
ncbi:hydroxyacylglutathione hydrolase, mitochondrial-like [Oscarella lobularis]|uniref:hydroxyacylglutathione hydrolase, mitochondrial-like n=1 Tax=Oscarella lobularis TaxID=121494 RepID=UPI003313D5FA